MSRDADDAEIPHEEKGDDADATVHDSQPQNDAITDFLTAVTSGNIEVVKITIEEKKVDLTPGSKVHRNAAYSAAEGGQLEMLEFLACHGFDLNLGPKTKTPIEVAAHNHHAAVVDFLLKNNVTLPKEVRTEEFIEAIEKHKFVLAQLWLSKELSKELSKDMNKERSKRDLDINGVNKDCLTPLYLFSKKGDLDAVQFLVRQGADMNVSTMNWCGSGRRLPLWGAIQSGHKNVVDFLLQNGVDIDNNNR